MSRIVTVALCTALALMMTSMPVHAEAQQAQTGDINRKVKSKVQPVYPLLASKMNIQGTARIEVIVAPNGTVKDARIVGGHPVLAGAALEAARKWRFEPGPAESTGIIEFKFEH